MLDTWALQTEDTEQFDQAAYVAVAEWSRTGETPVYGIGNPADGRLLAILAVEGNGYPVILWENPVK